MLKIRLRRMGKRHRPFYRVVVSDSRSVPQAPAVEEIGHYDPMTKPPGVRIDLERVEHWAGQGAQLSPAVRKLVKGVRTGRHEKVVEEAPAKKAAAPKVEEPAEEAASEAAAEAAAPAAEAETPEEAPAEAAEEPEAKAEAAAEEPAAEEPAAEEPKAEKEAKAEAAAEEPAAETDEEPEAEKKAAAEADDSASDQ